MTKVQILTFAMNERIKQIIDFYGLSIRGFEQKIFVTEGLIYRGLSRNSDFSSSVIAKILNNCPDISPDWLLLGKGEMLRRNECFCCPSRLGVGEKVEKNPAPDHVGIFVNHGGGNDTYNNYPDLLHVVLAQQESIRELTEQVKMLTQAIAKKLNQ